MRKRIISVSSAFQRTTARLLTPSEHGERVDQSNRSEFGKSENFPVVVKYTSFQKSIPVWENVYQFHLGSVGYLTGLPGREYEVAEC